ncbi:MAG TPA: methyltransferase domain-containing protein, partial [Candidatus Omnitrophota bacterium]|nr:methyltransferase domain-containing protein [Candidatus Omnitrophota bacterium]
MPNVSLLKRESRRHRPILRVISALLLFSFFSQEISHANPELFKTTARMSVSLPLFEVPSSVAVIEESREFSGEKAIVLIQDAHTNESAQINIAKVLGSVFEANKDIRTVFLEAGTGDDSLSYLREGSTREQRERIASAYLKKAWIQGADTFDLLSDKPVQLWGVEDKEFYREAIENYRAVREKQNEVRAYFDGVERGIQTVKNMLFNPRLQSFDEKCRLFDSGEVSFTDHVESLYAEAADLQSPHSFYPHLQALRALRRKEARIDFAKATEEQSTLVQTLGESDREILAGLSMESQKPFVLDSSEHQGEKAFYEFIRERIGDKARYPNLSAYLDYLGEAQRIDAAAVLSEKEAFESRIYQSLTRNRDEEKLIRASRALEVLRKLFGLTVSFKEFAEIENDPRAYDIVEITGFLNKKIMDLGHNYESVVFIIPSYDTAFQKAKKFYELTKKRDEAFLKNALSKLESDKEKRAVLVAGGYHAENLKKLFTQSGISYVCVRPQVLHETNQKKYENVLLGATHFSGPFTDVKKIATLPGKELVVRDRGRPVRVVESLSNELGARLAEKEGEPVRISEILPGLAVPGLRASLDQKDLLSQAKNALEALENLEKETQAVLGLNSEKSGAMNRFQGMAALLRLLSENAGSDDKFSFFSEDDWVIYTYLLENETGFAQAFLSLYSKQRAAFMPAQYRMLAYEQALKAVVRRLERLRESFERSLRTEERWTLERLRAAGNREKLRQTTQKMKSGAVLFPILMARGWEIGFESGSKIASPKFDYRKSRTLSMNELSRKEHPFHPDSYDGILNRSMMSQFQKTITPLADLLKDFSDAAQGSVVWADIGPGFGLALRQGKQLLGDRLITYGADMIDWSKSLTERPKGSFRYANRYGENLFNPKNDYRFVRGSMEAVVLPEKADLITAFYSMPYSEDPLAALANFYNQLKPGGVFLSSLFRYLVPSPDGAGLDHSDWVYQIAQSLAREGVEARVSGDVLMIRRKDERTLSLNLRIDEPPHRDREDRVHLKYMKIDPDKPAASLSGARLAEGKSMLEHYPKVTYQRLSHLSLVLKGERYGSTFYIKINLPSKKTSASLGESEKIQRIRELRFQDELFIDPYLGHDEVLLSINPDRLWFPGELSQEDIDFIEALPEVRSQMAHLNMLSLNLKEGTHYSATDAAIGKSFQDLILNVDSEQISKSREVQSKSERAILTALLDLVETMLIFHWRGYIHRDLSPEEAFRSDSGLIQFVDFGLSTRLQRDAQGEEAEVSFEDPKKDIPDLRIRDEERTLLKEAIYPSMILKLLGTEKDYHPSMRDLVSVYYIMQSFYERFPNQTRVNSPVKSYLGSKLLKPFGPQPGQSSRIFFIKLWMELNKLLQEDVSPSRAAALAQLDTSILPQRESGIRPKEHPPTLEDLIIYHRYTAQYYSKEGKGKGMHKTERPDLLTWRRALALIPQLEELKPDGFYWPDDASLDEAAKKVERKVDALLHSATRDHENAYSGNPSQRKLALLNDYLSRVARLLWIDGMINVDTSVITQSNKVAGKTDKDGRKRVSFTVGETNYQITLSIKDDKIQT